MLTQLEKSRLLQTETNGNVRYAQYSARMKLSKWLNSVEDVKFILTSTDLPYKRSSFSKVMSLKTIASLIDLVTFAIEIIHVPTLVQGEYVLVGRDRSGHILRKATEDEKKNIRALNGAVDRLTKALLAVNKIPKEIQDE